MTQGSLMTRNLPWVHGAAQPRCKLDISLHLAHFQYIHPELKHSDYRLLRRIKQYPYNGVSVTTSTRIILSADHDEDHLVKNVPMYLYQSLLDICFWICVLILNQSLRQITYYIHLSLHRDHWCDIWMHRMYVVLQKRSLRIQAAHSSYTSFWYYNSKMNQV